METSSGVVKVDQRSRTKQFYSRQTSHDTGFVEISSNSLEQRGNQIHGIDRKSELAQ